MRNDVADAVRDQVSCYRLEQRPEGFHQGNDRRPDIRADQLSGQEALFGLEQRPHLRDEEPRGQRALVGRDAYDPVLPAAHEEHGRPGRRGKHVGDRTVGVAARPMSSSVAVRQLMNSRPRPAPGRCAPGCATGCAQAP